MKRTLIEILSDFRDQEAIYDMEATILRIERAYENNKLSDSSAKAELVYEVITSLIGNIRPQGDSSRDAQSNNNLRVFIEVFDKMHGAIDSIAYDFKNSYEASVKEAVSICDNHLESMGIKAD